MKALFHDLSEHVWKATMGDMEEEQSPDQKTANRAPASAKMQRVSSHDLLACLDNLLRSIGLDLAAFLPEP